MCGIAGIVDFASEIDEGLLKRMTEAIKHRGPDDEGYFIDKEVGLGHRRLSIIDLKTGHQPIHNEDESIWIVCNGEIYNFNELRENLEKNGHNFFTRSDTEVIVHAYEEWGEDSVKRFNGMFAFAIWDSNKKQLFLARDRFGIKPLYYYFNDNKLLFGSEIKAILQDEAVKKVPNDAIIYEYLVYDLVEHREETFFTGIKKLMPAHYMIVDKNGIRIKRYWELKINEELDATDNNKEKTHTKDFYELLEDSIRLRLISEVPVGTCLSGGLDSSSIVCIINRLLFSEAKAREVIGEKQKTFSACYEDKKIDERGYIEDVIKFTNAEKNYVYPSAKSLWREIKKLIYYQDEPFGGPSVYAQWNVMRTASEKVRVVLDGQGGDELLAGYTPYYGIYFFELWEKRKLLRLLKEFIFSLDLVLPLVTEYLFWSKKKSDTKRLFNSMFISKYEGKAESRFRGQRKLAISLYTDMTKYSIPHLLRYEDRNSMAFSIEARVPFLDHRLVEYVFSLPVTWRIRNGWTKYILREALKGVIPEKIRKRRSKIGFATPEVEWLRELKDEIRAVFASEKFKARGYFNQEEILNKFDAFCEGKQDDFASLFWRVLNLEIWFEVFFDVPNERVNAEVLHENLLYLYKNHPHEKMGRILRGKGA